MSVANFIEEIQKKNMVVNYVQVRRNGGIIEDYSRLQSKTRLNTWSACKSIVSVAVGIAMDEGLMDPEEKMCDSFPEYLPEQMDKSLETLTVRDMLTMTTGLDNALFFGDDPIRYRTNDWVKYFFEQSFPHKNGVKFLYSNFNTYMLACLLERKVKQNFCEYLKPRLFDPLEIYSPDWTTCPKGHVHAANGLYLTIDELTRFGQMLLNKGIYNGHRVVSEQYLAEATRNQMPSAETKVKYGYQFWLPQSEEYYYAAGKFGQYCIVHPKKNAVVAVQSLESGELMPDIEKYILKEL